MRICNIMTISLFALLTLGGGALAQDADPADRRAERAAEIAELQLVLSKVEGALAKLGVIQARDYTLTQYDVRHLLFTPIDRVAPNLTIPSMSSGFRTGKGEGGLNCFDDEGGDGLLDPEQLESIIVGAVGEDRWDEPASIEVQDGYLIVRQSAIPHAQILRLLNDLKQRETRTIQLEVGFYTLPDELQRRIEDAALGAKGSLSPAILTLLDQGVVSGAAKLTGSAMLTSLNEQRVYLHQGGEQAFVSSFDRSSGGTGDVVASVSDPIVEVLRTGLALDMRATLIGDGPQPQVSMDVRFIRSRPVAMVRRATPWGVIDMPRVAVDSVRTNARVPSGGGMLVFSARASRDEAQPDVTIIVRPLVIQSTR